MTEHTVIIDSEKSTERGLSDGELRSVITDSRIYQAGFNRYRIGSGYLEKDDPFIDMLYQDELDQIRSFVEAHPVGASEMIRSGVDSLHGTTSLNLQPILEHGIVPNSHLRKLGVVALGKESYSLPLEREGVHVVPVGYAGETVRYAEGRLAAKSSDFVNPSNYKNFLHYVEIDTSSMAPSFAAHFNNHGLEATLIQQAIASGDLIPDAVVPIVLGIDSSAISRDVAINSCDSGVRGDTLVKGIIPRSAIKILYTTTDAMPGVQSQLETHQLGESIVVRDIQSIH